MKKVSYVLAALATIAIAAPAAAQDKPMMGKGGTGMHHSMHHHKMMVHHEMRLTHHKKMIMKKDGM
jgi:Spy/CpxP family protein refolding chaperone